MLESRGEEGHSRDRREVAPTATRMQWELLNQVSRVPRSTSKEYNDPGCSQRWSLSSTSTALFTLQREWVLQLQFPLYMEHSKALQVWHEGPWFDGEQSGAGFVFGLNNLRDLFQPKYSYYSMEKSTFYCIKFSLSQSTSRDLHKGAARLSQPIEMCLSISFFFQYSCLNPPANLSRAGLKNLWNL